MKITFLGTCHGNPEKDRYFSSILMECGEKKYLVDGGAPLSELLPVYDIPYQTIENIFITHTHDDHNMGLLPYFMLLSQKKYEHVTTCVYVPTTETYENMKKAVEAFLPWNENITFCHYQEGCIFDDGIVRVTAIQVQHIPFSYSFMVESEGKRILFSGDLRKDMPDYPTLLFEKDFDLLVLEGAHTVLNQDSIVEKVTKSKIKQLIITHIAEAKNSPETIQKLFDTQKGRVCHRITDGFSIEL